MKKNVKGIVLHCSAGFGDIVAIQRFWRNDLGWRSKGYAAFVETNGTVWWLQSNTLVQGYATTYNDNAINLVTNGVAGYNSNYVHLCFQGGVRRDGTRLVAADTFTAEQHKAMHEVIKKVIDYVKPTKDFGVWGHFDFSRDKNGSGVIESWERIKECPSFPVMLSDYHRLYSTADRIGTLPYNPPKAIATTYTVKAGDTLFRIAANNNTTVSEIQRLNNMLSTSILVGQVLRVR